MRPRPRPRPESVWPRSKIFCEAEAEATDSQYLMNHATYKYTYISLLSYHIAYIISQTELT